MKAAISNLNNISPSISSIPDDILREFWGYLKVKDAYPLASLSKRMNGLFSPALKVSKFLMLVAHGEQAKAEALIKDDPGLLLQHGNLTDYSGRIFNNITAYEYAYWAMDTHMCRMMEPYMDSATKATMLVHCEAIEATGLTYYQHGHRKNDAHFNLKPIINEYANYLNDMNCYCRDIPGVNFQSLIISWKAIGMLQRDLPVHVINEYCRSHDMSFEDESTLPRSKMCYDHLQEKIVTLVYTDLGDKYTLMRGRDDTCQGSKYFPCGFDADIDSKAIKKLNQVIIADVNQSLYILGKRVEPEHRIGLSP